MAEYPDLDCPPHFYARGNNPQFSYFVELMKYANRMCSLLNGGTHVASVAVLYDGELDWAGTCMPMQKICRVLTENQIEFDIVCLDMLRNLASYNGSVSNGKVEMNGVRFDALLVPQADYVPSDLISFAKSADAFPMFFIDSLPKGILQDQGGRNSEDDFSDNMIVIPLSKLVDTLLEKQMRKLTLTPAFSQISVYHYQKDVQEFMVVNESADCKYTGVLRIPASQKIAYYDAFTDSFQLAEEEYRDGEVLVNIELEPGESCFLMEKADTDGLPIHLSSEKQLESCGKKIDLSKGWKIKRTKATEKMDTCKEVYVDRLAPISDEAPTFSGIIHYTKEITLSEIPEKAYFYAENVYEVMRVSINGKVIGTRLTPPYQLDISCGLKEGENEILVEVANAPARDQLNFPMPPFDFSHEPLEPSGMSGKIELYYS